MDTSDRLILEAALPAEVAARLARHPAITTRRTGRSRGSAEERAWHDTSDGALAALGLALETGRGPRRLLRSRPESDAFWCPGMVEPHLRLLARDDAPEEAGGATLLPIAAFSGRRLALPLGPVQAVLLQGRVRTVTAEEAVARLTLSGPPEAVIALAGALAEELPLLPPVATLAEHSRALARGEAIRPRRQGAPDTAGAATVEQALAHAIGHLLEVALWHAPGAIAGTTTEGVHQLRVALRRLRSVLRLFRRAMDGPALRAFDAALRGILAALGPARDWDVWLGGLGAELAAAMPGERRIARLIALAEAERRRAYDSLRAVLGGPAWRVVIWQGVALAQRRLWRGDASPESLAALEAPLAEFAVDVLARRWKRLRRDAQDIAERDAPALHTLRLDAKRLRYAAEIFAPLWPGRPARRFVRRLARLQDALGIANDTAVATGLLRSLKTGGSGWAGGVAEGWAAAKIAHSRQDAIDAWKRLKEQESFWPKR